MRNSSRFLVAPLLLVIYLLITMSPLAPLALKSPRLAHAVTGECSGDCDICGCSPERRANHTCCCWLHKKKHEHDHDEENLPPCCRKKHHGGKAALTCNCPCGSDKQLGLWGGERPEQLPYRFLESLPAFSMNVLSSFHGNRLTERHGEPPDPPPRLAVLS